MSSLTDLNTHSDGTVSFTDNRYERIIYEPVYAANLTDVNFTNIVTPFENLYNIVDIIKPDVIDIYLEIDTGNSDISVSWPSLPTGVSTAQTGNVYKALGIDSVSDWDTIATANIVLGNDYFGDISYTATLYYTVNGVYRSLSWSVSGEIKFAQITSAFTINILPDPTIRTSANLISYFSVIPDTALIFGDAVLTSEFGFEVYDFLETLETTASLSCSPDYLVGYSAELSSAFGLSATPRNYLFDDTTFVINNPYATTNGMDFAFDMAVDSTKNVITASLNNHSQYCAVSVNATTGTTEFSFPRTSGQFQTSILGYNDDYILIMEDLSNGNDKVTVWKKQSTGDLYTSIDSVTFVDPGPAPEQYVNIQTQQNSTCFSDNNYMIFCDVQFNEDETNPNGKIYVYSVDKPPGAGLTLEHTHEGVNQTIVYTPTISRTFGQELGRRGMGINNTYYAFSEHYDFTDDTTGSFHRVFVYDIVSGTLQYTFNDSNSKLEVMNLAFINSDLYVTYFDPINTENKLAIYNLSTGTQSSIVTLDYTGDITNDTIQLYDSTYIFIGNNLHDINTGKLENSISPSYTHNEIIIIDADTIALGDHGYDGTYIDQGRILIKSEDSL